MAKKQTFEDKVAGKGGATKKAFVKLVKTYREDKTKGLRFSEKIVAIPNGKNPNQYLSELIKK
tara:strand:- start:240 stop:428 length:189 start_codon:yes stop_codon:yes gene_type:complete